MKPNIQFTISNENGTPLNCQEPKSQSENVLMKHNVPSSIEEMNFLSLADLDKIRFKNPMYGKEESDFKNKSKFKYASMSFDDIQNRTTYEVVDKFFSDGKIDLYNMNEKRIPEDVFDEKISQSNKLTISADHIDIYDSIYYMSDEKSLKTHNSLPVISTFTDEIKVNSKISQNQSRFTESQPGTSYERSSIDDEMSFKSATDNTTEDLEAIRHRVIGAHPILTTLIVKQGLLLNSKFNQSAKDGNLASSWNMSFKNQPPPPYTDPMASSGGNQHSRVQPNNPNEQNNSGLPPYSLHDESGRTPGRVFEDDPIFLRKMRHKFIKKVYAILLVQLAITFTFILICTYQNNVRTYVRNDFIGGIVAIVFTFMLMLIIGCYEQVRKIWPVNFIMLFGLVFAMTYVVSFSATVAPKHLVLIAIGVTFLVCTLISIFAWQTKWDITGMGFMLGIIGLIFVVFSFIAMFLYMFTGSKIVHLILCGIGVLYVSAMLVFDTQRIVGGRRYDLSPEEYIAGALSLYFDIVMFFWFLLQVIRG